MKIYLLTPVYATSTQGSGATPVVHYFAKEWVKQGHEVHVFNLRPTFPSIYYKIGRLFQQKLTSIFGAPIHSNAMIDGDYEEDGVKSHIITLKKYIPHSNYSKKMINYAINRILSSIEIMGTPDVWVGHWLNPQLEILSQLKMITGVKTCLVLHNNIFNFKELYGNRYDELIQNIDIIGFRNNTALKRYCEKYGNHKNMFVVSSGVSSNFLLAGDSFAPDFSKGVNNFIYVGMLMQRKYPLNVLVALNNVSHDYMNQLIYVGDGDEISSIKRIMNDPTCKTKVTLTGRIQRDQIIEKLKESQVFIMISKGEVFGLVYLEAMAMGLITIGSRNEGIDGIIEDGKNGFLCEAGNTNELERIIEKIQCMSSEDLISISNSAKLTAKKYSDSNVAASYLSHIL